MTKNHVNQFNQAYLGANVMILMVAQIAFLALHVTEFFFLLLGVGGVEKIKF